MDIKSIAELAKIADLCRKKGIETIKITADSVEFKLGEKPTLKKKLPKGSDNTEFIPQMTDEDLLMWSSNPMVGSN